MLNVPWPCGQVRCKGVRDDGKEEFQALLPWESCISTSVGETAFGLTTVDK